MKKEERIMQIAEKALIQVYADHGVNPETLMYSGLGQAYDNMDIEHESKMKDAELFEYYYDWFEDWAIWTKEPITTKNKWRVKHDHN